MTPNFHSAIEAWLAAHPPHVLRESGADGPGTRAALLPFWGSEYLFMQPRGERAELGPPEWQIAKGTRMARVGGQWIDTKSPPAQAEMEALPVAALREGREELGLTLENIAAWYDCGAFPFASARTGKEKFMRVFAAQMLGREAFDTPHASTGATRWMDAASFAQAGRADHARIVSEVDKLLKIDT